MRGLCACVAALVCSFPAKGGKCRYFHMGLVSGVWERPLWAVDALAETEHEKGHICASYPPIRSCAFYGHNIIFGLQYESTYVHDDACNA